MMEVLLAVVGLVDCNTTLREEVRVVVGVDCRNQQMKRVHCQGLLGNKKTDWDYCWGKWDIRYCPLLSQTLLRLPPTARVQRWESLRSAKEKYKTHYRFINE